MQVLLLILCVVSFSFQSLFTKLYNDHYRGPEEAATPVFSVAYGFLIAVASLITGAFRFSPSALTILFGILNGVMLILYNKSLIRAGDTGSYSFMMIANMFGGILLPILCGVIFLKDTVSVTGIAAIALMLLAMVLINLDGLPGKKPTKSYFVWCAVLFLANGLFGTFMNTQATVMNGLERTEMLVIQYLLSSLFALLFEASQKRLPTLRKGFRMGKKSAVFLILACAAATAGANLMLYLLSVMDTSVFCTIDDGGVLVLSFLYSFILFREKPNRIQWVGMALAVASIILINL